MKAGSCEIVFVLDRSSSMGIIKNETVMAYNNFVEEQKRQPGEATFTLILFNQIVHTVGRGSLSNAPIMDHMTYQPSGMTAWVLSVTVRMAASRSRLSVSGSTSTITGSAPR